MAQGVMFIVSGVSNTISNSYRKAAAFILAVQAYGGGCGAALLGLADAGAYYTGATAEAALAELGVAMVGKIITDPGDAGAIPVTRSGTCAIVTAAAETRTLAIPTFVNQRLVLYLKTDGGDCVVTVASAINLAGNTHITLNDANDSVQLVGAYNGSALCWRVAENDGCTLAA